MKIVRMAIGFHIAGINKPVLRGRCYYN